MSPSLAFVWLVFAILAKPDVGAFLLNEKSMASAEISEDSGHYNIYCKIDDLQKSLHGLKKKMIHLDTQLKQVLRNISLDIEKLAKDDTPVGFTTKLSGSYSDTTSHIKGHSILYNQGNAYNGTVFTCPSSGQYLFHVSIITNSNSNGIWIYKNSLKLTLIYSGSASNMNGASASAATWLDTGDRVYLRPYSVSLSLDGNSAFTGAKIN